jgi:hypothetical protein
MPVVGCKFYNNMMLLLLLEFRCSVPLFAILIRE